MAAKRPKGISLAYYVRKDRVRAEDGTLAVPEHRRKLNRKARESLMSTDGSVSLADAIEDDYVRLAKEDEKHRALQSEKAKAPRAVGDDERTMADIVAELARRYRDDDPRDVWPHLRGAIEDWVGDECVEVGTGDKPAYRYPFRSAKGTRTITLKHFGQLLRDARKRLLPER